MQTLCPAARKFIQQFTEPSKPALAEVAFAIEGREGSTLAVVKDRPRPRNPVLPLGVNEVSHNLERIPRALAFAPRRPGFRQAPQERVKHTRRALQQSHGFLEVVHISSRSL